jgi:hypothetical protein
MNQFRYKLKFACFQLPLVVADSIDNRRHCTAESRILITRHAAKRTQMFRHFLAWVKREVPELRSRMEFHRLPCHVHDWSRIALHVSWVGDMIDLCAPRGFQQGMRLAEECRRRGVPLLNPIDGIAATGKARGGELMRQAGIRTPRCVPIHDPRSFRGDLGGMSFPFLIRDERGHGRGSKFIESEADLHAVDFSQFNQPIAAEFIDTRDASDGLFRKYRFVVAGDLGLPRHMIPNKGWEVRPERRIDSPSLREEELAYIHSPDPHHATLFRAARALGLDIAGFDYSFDRQGQIVIWEANSFLDLSYPSNPLSRHIFPSVERTFAAVARIYLLRSGATVPTKLDDMLCDVASYSSTADLPQSQSELCAV